MVTHMSSRGQVVIPKAIRDRLKLDRDTELQVEVDGDRVILSPVRSMDWRGLRGHLRGLDALSDLEQEHRAEVERTAR